MNVKNNKNKTLLIYSSAERYEFYIVFLLLFPVIIFAVWPLISATNNAFPITTDGLGHLTRIDYLAKCLKEGNWPSWFPYWYCGSTVFQYYPPLSFLLAAPVQLITDNVMISFKFLVVICQFIGALGVWFFGYRFIGRWVGIIGAILYACQPYLLKTLVIQGAIAQGPVFALTPWLLVFSLYLFEERSRGWWLLVSLTSTLLIFSHAMHAYLIALCIGLVIILLTILRKGNIKGLFLWIGAMGLGAGLGAFWVIPGVTHLENPLVPYLLPEIASTWVVKLSWFRVAERTSGGWYAGSSMFVIAFIAILLVKKREDNASYIISLFIAMIISVCFSLGYEFPLFKLLPLHTSLVTMRFLSFSVLAVTILIMYLIKQVINIFQKHKKSKYFALLLTIFMLVVILIDVNPWLMPIKTELAPDLQQSIDKLSANPEPFEQGRFTWISPLRCEIAFFPMKKNLNMADGWNIEGTPHNRNIWNHNIAISAGYFDYVTRNILEWNTRSAIVDNRFSLLHKSMLKNGFKIIAQDQVNSTFLNPSPSSYFMRPERNALAIGKAAPGLVMSFPWFIQGRTACLEDYAPEELNRFKIIYLIEPEVKNFLRFQEIVEGLAQSGKTVIVEWGRADRWPLFDVVPYTEPILPGARLEARPESPIPRAAGLDPDPRGQVFAIGKLDGVWHTMRVGEVDAPVIGYKNVGGNRVYFVGLALGQQLNSGHGAEIRAILEELIDLGQPYKSIVPNPFPVSDADWRHDGFSFRYSSEQPTPVWVSVTYTPRWKATVDGLPVKVYNLENLILVDLPAGEHTVNFKYGMTWVGWLGIGLSLLTALITVIIYFNFERLNNFLDRAVLKARQAVESIGS